MGSLAEPSWRRLLMLSAVGFSIELAYAVEASYAIPALRKSGLQERYASVMWAVGPVLGILFQSYLGSASDRCTSSFGRRRPFILGLSIAACASLALFPYGRFLSNHLHLSAAKQRGFVIFFTSTTFVAMDFSLDALQSPTRSYLLDSVSAQRAEKANYLYTTMVSLGATVGSLVSALPWEKMGLMKSSDFDSQVEVVFAISLVVLVAGAALCLSSVPERTPQAAVDVNSDYSDGERLDSSTRTLSSHNPTDSQPLKHSSISLCLWKCCGKCLREFFGSLHGTFQFAVFMSLAFFHVWLMCFLSWFATLSSYLFLTDYVGEVIYHGVAVSDDIHLKSLYNSGVRMGCVGLTLMSVASFVSSLVLEWISERISLRLLTISIYCLYCISLAVLLGYPSVPTMLLMCTVDGVYFANLISVPFALISKLEDSGKLLRKPWTEEGDIKGKAVSFLWVSMFLAQFILASSIGSLMSVYGGAGVVMWVAFSGGCLSLISTPFVSYSPRPSS